jgi:hypothetical protein
MLFMGKIAIAEEALLPNNYSGWRGGIGIVGGFAALEIPDVTELGYEIFWAVMKIYVLRKTLDIAVFRNWNSIIEINLKDSRGHYDYSQLLIKMRLHAAPFDAWAERYYGMKGLSRYARILYKLGGSYGDIYGSMDLSSENDLVKAIISKQLNFFKSNGLMRGGIGLDNAASVPRPFLEALQKSFHERGLGIAANGCPTHIFRI